MHVLTVLRLLQKSQPFRKTITTESSRPIPVVLEWQQPSLSTLTELTDRAILTPCSMHGGVPWHHSVSILRRTLPGSDTLQLHCFTGCNSYNCYRNGRSHPQKLLLPTHCKHFHAPECPGWCSLLLSFCMIPCALVLLELHRAPMRTFSDQYSECLASFVMNPCIPLSCILTMFTSWRSPPRVLQSVCRCNPGARLCQKRMAKLMEHWSVSGGCFILQTTAIWLYHKCLNTGVLICLPNSLHIFWWSASYASRRRSCCKKSLALKWSNEIDTTATGTTSQHGYWNYIHRS